MPIDPDLLARVRARAETLVDDQEDLMSASLAIIEAMKAEGLRPNEDVWGAIFVNLRRKLLYGDPLTIEKVGEEKVCEEMEAIFGKHPGIGFRAACRELMRQLNFVGDFDEVVRAVIEYRKRERASVYQTEPRATPAPQTKPTAATQVAIADSHGESSEPEPKRKRKKAEKPPDPQGRLNLVFPPEDEGDRTGGASS